MCKNYARITRRMVRARCTGLLIFVLCGLACRRTVNSADQIVPEQGITLALAGQRAQQIENVRYDLSFTIPSSIADPIAGREILRFSLHNRTGPLILDFKPGGESLTSIAVGGSPSKFRAVNGHIVIPQEELSDGENTL